MSCSFFNLIKKFKLKTKLLFYNHLAFISQFIRSKYTLLNSFNLVKMGKDRNNKKPVLKPALLIDKCIDSKNDNDDDDRLWSVFSTLVLFTALMFIVPLGCYFLSKSFLFEGISFQYELILSYLSFK